MHKINRYNRKFLRRKEHPDIQRSEKSFKSKSQLNYKRLKHTEEELDEELETFLLEEVNEKKRTG